MGIHNAWYSQIFKLLFATKKLCDNYYSEVTKPSKNDNPLFAERGI
jgi:hypothetical protein